MELKSDRHYIVQDAHIGAASFGIFIFKTLYLIFKNVSGI